MVDGKKKREHVKNFPNMLPKLDELAKFNDGLAYKTAKLKEYKDGT